MKLNKAFGLLAGSVMLIIPAVNSTNSGYAVFANDTYNESTINPKANNQYYVAADGTNHTVHWAWGIDYPKMSGNLKDMDGSNSDYFTYFEDVIDGEVISQNYIALPAPEKGYYDINKDWERRDIERPTCYLVAALNNIMWWLNNNKTYVMQYANMLKTTDYFGSEFGLAKILPYNQQTWDDFYAEPQFNVNSQGLLSQDLGPTNPGDYRFATKYFAPYYNRGDGFAMDFVFDFFFNGYLSKAYDKNPSLLPENLESEYRKDPLGGWFYPIFGKERLGKRDMNTTYSHVKELLVDSFENGKGVTLSFYTASDAYTHAITIWGVETDENGEMIRLFYSDSDDYGAPMVGSNYARGLSSFEIHKNPYDDTFKMNSLNNGVYSGSQVQMITTLDLAQDKWEAKFKDLQGPVSPFISITESFEAGINSERYITVDAISNDSGYLTYQWYVANKLNEPGEKLTNQTKNKIKVDTSKVGEKYYYCEITNHKNGLVLTSNSEYVKVSITDGPVTNAAAPIVSINVYQNKVEYEIGEETKDFVVTATSPDNGVLTYQWFSTGSSTPSGGYALPGETSPVLKISSKEAYSRLYYCVVTNTNNKVNGRVSTSKATDKAYKVEVYDFAHNYALEFLNANVCGTNDNTPAMSNIFLQFKSKFEQEFNLSFMRYSKNYLMNAKGDQFSSDPVKQMLAKYDRIIALHGDDTLAFPDFLQRKNTPNFTYPIQSVSIDKELKDNLVYLIIAGVIVGVMTLTTVIFLINNKKRKEK